MKKVIRLTESDLTRIVRRIIKESKFGSFDDEVFDEFDDLQSKHGHDTKWFDKGESGKKMFDTYKDKHKRPFKVRNRRD